MTPKPSLADELTAASPVGAWALASAWKVIRPAESGAKVTVWPCTLPVLDCTLPGKVNAKDTLAVLSRVDGSRPGNPDGNRLPRSVGNPDGSPDGKPDGRLERSVGNPDGSRLPRSVGNPDGSRLLRSVGKPEGNRLPRSVGNPEGNRLDRSVGSGLG